MSAAVFVRACVCRVSSAFVCLLFSGVRFPISLPLFFSISLLKLFLFVHLPPPLLLIISSLEEETHITEDEDSERLRETESLLGYPSPGSPVPHQQQQQQQQFAVSSDGLTEATMVDMGDDEEDEEGLTGKERMLRMMMNNNGGKMMTAITTTNITTSTTITTTATNHGYEDI